MRTIGDIETRIAPLRQQLANHPLYAQIQTLEDLHTFMESHVFAVWDFMSLLKALQSRLTCVAIPWIPAQSPESARFINEIVLGEESDVYEGRAISHFELYVKAMQECGANTNSIRQLLREIHASPSIEDAMHAVQAPEAAITFVSSTFQWIREGKPHAIAAAFTFGREDVIPDMFRGLVRDLDRQLSGQLHTFLWYLERHIEVDGDDHGPLALRMVADLCGNDDTLWAEATDAAESALRARLQLWDGIAENLSRTEAVCAVAPTAF